jgi:hypothetical protein
MFLAGLAEESQRDLEAVQFLFVYGLCHVLYISVHRCPCLRVCVTFCAVFSFFMSDVDVFKEGSLCTLIFHRYSK